MKKYTKALISVLEVQPSEAIAANPLVAVDNSADGSTIGWSTTYDLGAFSASSAPIGG